MRESALTLLLLACAFAARASAQVPENGGPYNATFLEGGVGIERELKGAGRLVAAGAPFHIYAWVRPAPSADQRGATELISIGRGRALTLHDGHLAYSGGTKIVTGAPVAPGRWTHVAVSSDGKSVTLYADGREYASLPVQVPSVAPSISLAAVRDFMPHFGGSLVDATVGGGALTAQEVEALVRARPNFDLVQMWNVGVGWEWQSRANTGLWRQQDPWTLPHGGGGFSEPVAKPFVERPALEPLGDNRWQLHGWRLAAAPEVSADGGELSDSARLRFGIREVSYDLSLFDGAGRLRRVNVQTADGKLRGERLIDVRHEAIKQSPRGWAESLTAAGERSPAVKDAVKDRLPEPHLAIRVNGVRIAARGGSWGMDDALKRIGRERLEPYFRLRREARRRRPSRCTCSSTSRTTSWSS